MRKLITAFWVLVAVCLLAFSAEAGSKKKAKRFYNAGLKHAKASDFDKAIDKFQSALRENPNMYLAALDLGMVYKMENRLPEAVAAYELAVSLKPKRPKARRAYGNLLIELYAYGSAIGQFEMLAKMESKDVRVFVNLGRSCLGAEDYDGAIGAFLHVLTMESDNFQATMGLGHAYYKEKQLEKSRGYFEKATYFNAKSIQAWKGLGDVYLEQDKKQDAKNAYKKACELSGRKQTSVCEKATWM